MNCQDCKTQEQRNRRHFFCGFIQNQFHLLKREQQTITTLYEIRYLFLLFTKIIIMMMMMNMLMMIIIIIRNITSYQGWIKLENFTKIRGFFRYLYCCYLPSGSSNSIIFYGFVFSATQKCIRLSPRALMQQNSNCDIVQCYLYNIGTLNVHELF